MSHVTPVVGPFLATLLMAVFFASAFAKVVYREETRDWFRQLFPILPAGLASLAVIAVISVEVLIAVVLAAAPVAGASAAGVWTAVASVVLIQGRRRATSCGCFGLKQRLGPGVATRNALVLLAAVALVTTGPVTPLALLLPVGVVAGVTVVVLRETFEARGAVA